MPQKDIFLVSYVKFRATMTNKANFGLKIFIHTLNKLVNITPKVET